MPRGGKTSGTRYGNGAGIGGEARGKGGVITAENAREVKALDTPERARTKEERAAALLEHLEKLAITAERQNDQIAATVAALNRLEGLPVAKIDATVTRATVSDKPLTEEEWLATYSVGAAEGTPESTH